MDMLSPAEERRNTGFPTAQPTDALRRDHDFARKLFETYLGTQDREVKREAGTRLLSVLELHASLEESVFYPKVRSIDASLVGEFGDEHQQARQMMDQLTAMNMGDAQSDAMIRQLADTMLMHIEREERDLFPRVESAGIDLEALALEMQAFEANVVSAQARASDQPPARK